MTNSPVWADAIICNTGRQPLCYGTINNIKEQEYMDWFLTSLLSLSKTYCCVTTSNQFLSTSSPSCVSSHSFSLIRALTWVWKASSDKLFIFSPKLTRKASILSSTKSVLREYMAKIKCYWYSLRNGLEDKHLILHINLAWTWSPESRRSLKSQGHRRCFCRRDTPDTWRKSQIRSVEEERFTLWRTKLYNWP